jgi:hypothetical protein
LTNETPNRALLTPAERRRRSDFAKQWNATRWAREGACEKHSADLKAAWARRKQERVALEAELAVLRAKVATLPDMEKEEQNAVE